jgi:predicted nucleotidyltransferase
MSTERIGPLLRRLRKEKGWSLRQAASAADVDVAILSKMERGERRWTRELVLKLSECYEYDSKALLVLFLSEKVIYTLGDENLALEALKVAERQLVYETSEKTDRSRILKELKKVIAQFSGIEKAWIYGSFARKEERPDSDIDVAIETNNQFSYFDLAEVQHRAGEATGRKVDIGFIDSFRPHILEQVQEDLQLIYEKG